jgi:hypothetical protein
MESDGIPTTRTSIKQFDAVTSAMANDADPPEGSKIRRGVLRKAPRTVKDAERSPLAVVHAGAEDPAQLSGRVPSVVQHPLVATQRGVGHSPQRRSGVLGQ